jgi:hypothetical protein
MSFLKHMEPQMGADERGWGWRENIYEGINRFGQFLGV